MSRAPPAERLMAMNISAHAATGGLYSFKSWYAGRLTPVRRGLVAANVPPAAITVTGIVFGGGAGAALALLRPGPAAGAAVAVLLAARLACANLDGGVARDGDRATPFGSVLNEVGDRAAELAALTGCLAFAPTALVLAAALAATLPSWWRWPAPRLGWAGSRAARSARPNAACSSPCSLPSAPRRCSSARSRPARR